MNAQTKGQFLLVVFIAVILLVSLAPATASTGAFQIVGNINDTLGNPVAGLGISVDDYVGDFYTSATENDGSYIVVVESDSNYRVALDCDQLTALGYKCVPTVALTVNDGSLELNFTLEPASAALQITNAILPVGNVGLAYHAQLTANGGKAPYSWQLAPDSTNLPAGLSLDSDGVISGTPETNSHSSIDIQVSDSSAVTTNKTLSVVINARPFLNALAWRTNQFSLWLSGASNQNYTVQTCTDLNSSNWTQLVITNNPETNAFLVTDPTATNKQRLYRVLIGP